jgi:hypothetical protein
MHESEREFRGVFLCPGGGLAPVLAREHEAFVDQKVNGEIWQVLESKE